ncbi:tail fiber domain-containing protein [Rhodocytophaga rosea]|uniref:Tail fiber domain-containing protein n=1 Tax=Rhodocytophaga rosea TaxID=2704465 RepID=A0A6C0GS19_9BACT|nr:tail fiber domain-containing protein [Rhodocytophaga rosea]QHT70868.1 tail fiber domain-containing protein [Rhodocytophaga rosea]
MKITLLFSFLALSWTGWHSVSYSQSYNAGVGSGSQGYNSIHLGAYAGRVSTGSGNNFVGYQAGYSNTYASSNIFLGNQTGYNNIGGDDNIFIGSLAGYSNSHGDKNIFIGIRAGILNTTGYYNNFIGDQAGYSTTTGYANNFIGTDAGLKNSTGHNNSIIGFRAGYYNTSGYYNSFVGALAGFNNNTGFNNVMLGYRAGYSNTASNNTFIGKEAGFKTTTGSVNTFIGGEAGYNNISGSNNVFVGRLTAQNNNAGFENTFLGNSAGSVNTIGNKNTSLGYLAGPSINNLTNATAIGHRARVNISNALVLGSINGVNGATATIQVGIGTASPSYLLHANGTAAKPGGGSWTAASDKRLKHHIKDFTEGLATLEKIRPVTFHYNGKAGLPTEKEYVGVIAQEMQQIAPYMVGEFSYQDSTGAEEKYLDYDATALTYILVNATKEQQQQIQSLQQQNQDLKQEVAALKELIVKHIPQAGKEKARLGQNIPNPYMQSTSIPYQLPLTAKSASIKVYSSSGQELKSFDLTGSTQGIITLTGGLFAAGTYVYTLFVDGISLESKKLVLTK